MSTLVVITARGGSKRLPGKNVRLLQGRPLIHYSIDHAKAIADDEDICVSTDDDEIIRVVEAYPLAVHFKRPAELATDSARSFDVLLHALDEYERRGRRYETVVLLQPTSPFRLHSHLTQALAAFSDECDAVVSVAELQGNPFSLIMTEKEEGLQSPAPPIEATNFYRLNGSIYVLRAASLRRHASLGEFSRICKFVMPHEYSVDIDTPLDWAFAEFLLTNRLVGGNAI